jgi:hypothetical protein
MLPTRLRDKIRWNLVRSRKAAGISTLLSVPGSSWLLHYAN